MREIHKFPIIFMETPCGYIYIIIRNLICIWWSNIPNTASDSPPLFSHKIESTHKQTIKFHAHVVFPTLLMREQRGPARRAANLFPLFPQVPGRAWRNLHVGFFRLYRKRKWNDKGGIVAAAHSEPGIGCARRTGARAFFHSQRINLDNGGVPLGSV